MTLNLMLHWFGIYLAVGLPVLILLRVLAAIKSKLRPTGSMLREIMQELHGKDSPRVKWTRVAGQLLMYPLILLIWPVVIWIVIQDQWFSSKTDWKPDPEAAFNCRRQHLIKVVVPDAAEADAKVVDPLGRVPDLPFGHLNAGWRALLANRQIGDTLWYFHIPGDSPESEALPPTHQWAVPRGAKRGYALVQSGKVRAEFIFEWD
jgi:hypothetical protein